jgi:hypothetical protein
MAGVAALETLSDMVTGSLDLDGPSNPNYPKTAFRYGPSCCWFFLAASLGENDALLLAAKHYGFGEVARTALSDEIIKRAQKYLTAQEIQKEEKVEKPKVVEVTEKIKKKAPDYLTDNAKKVYDFIGNEPVHIDEIINHCGMTTDKTLSAITELEIYGLVTQLSGRRYKINTN